jgi:hypothetical protein
MPSGPHYPISTEKITANKAFSLYPLYSPEEKKKEEARVHEITRKILFVVQIPGMKDVLKFYDKWRLPTDDLRKI